MFKVKDLIKILQDMPEDAIVTIESINNKKSFAIDEIKKFSSNWVGIKTKQIGR